MAKKKIDRKHFIKFLGGATLLGLMWPRKQRLTVSQQTVAKNSEKLPLVAKKSPRSIARTLEGGADVKQKGTSSADGAMV